MSTKTGLYWKRSKLWSMTAEVRLYKEGLQLHLAYMSVSHPSLWRKIPDKMSIINFSRLETLDSFEAECFGKWLEGFFFDWLRCYGLENCAIIAGWLPPVKDLGAFIKHWKNPANIERLLELVEYKGLFL